MERGIESVLVEALAKWRCVALLGPRQVGKSFLLKEILKKKEGGYLSFDDPMIREEAAKDPVAWIKRHYHPGRLFFLDEAAKVPEIFSAVKVVVDEQDPKPTGICLANSGNYLLLKRVKESLAGRVHLLPIYPLSWREIFGVTSRPGLFDLLEGNDPPENVGGISAVEIRRSREERLMWGGYPVPVHETDPLARQQWAADYFQTYILPLVLEQFVLRDVAAFERTARLLFAGNGRAFNASEVAKIVGISQPTVMTYLHQLIAMMVVSLLDIFARNPIKRLAKQPKLYAVDPLLLHIPLSTGFSLQSTADRQLMGSLYEAFLFNEIRKTMANAGRMADYFTWRTQDKAEVDLVLTSGSSCLPIEIKYSKTVSGRDASGLRSFLADNPEAKRGIIAFAGEKIIRISEKIWAVPDWWLLGCQ